MRAHIKSPCLGVMFDSAIYRPGRPYGPLSNALFAVAVMP